MFFFYTVVGIKVQGTNGEPMSTRTTSDDIHESSAGYNLAELNGYWGKISSKNKALYLYINPLQWITC